MVAQCHWRVPVCHEGPGPDEHAKDRAALGQRGGERPLERDEVMGRMGVMMGDLDDHRERRNTHDDRKLVAHDQLKIDQGLPLVRRFGPERDDGGPANTWRQQWAAPTPAA